MEDNEIKIMMEIIKTAYKWKLLSEKEKIFVVKMSRDDRKLDWKLFQQESLKKIELLNDAINVVKEITRITGELQHGKN